MSDASAMHHMPCGCEIDPPDIARQRRTHTTPHRIGDVCRINESVHTPILDILVNTSHLQNSPNMPAMKSAREQLFDRHRRPTKKHRPCIYMGYSRLFGASVAGADRRHPRVCITASYESTPISRLPGIYQHFSFAIPPHYVISQDPSKAHAHPTPCWGKENVWVVAWQYETVRKPRDPWKLSEKEKADHGFQPEEHVAPYFSEKALTIIMAECNARMAEWEKKCRDDPSFAREREREFWDHWNDPARKLEDETNYTASNASATTHLSARSFRPSGDFATSLASINEVPEDRPWRPTAQPYLEVHPTSLHKASTVCPSSENGYNGAQSVIPGARSAEVDAISPSTPYVPPHRRSSDSGASRVGVPYRSVKTKSSTQSIQSLWSGKSITKFGQRWPSLPRRRGSQGDA